MRTGKDDIVARFEAAIERATGKTCKYLRETPIDEQRAAIEEERGEPIVFESRFPNAGRGFVLRDRLVPHEEVEREFERALRVV